MAWIDTDRALGRQSWYAASAPPAVAQPVLAGDLRVDVAIVGGGLAGLSAALDLAARGRRVAVLEAGQLGEGASGRNGGQAIHGLACDIDTVEAQLGTEAAQRIWRMSLDALDLLRARIAEHAIDCDWQAGWLGLATSARKARALRDSLDGLARRHGSRYRWLARDELPAWIDSPRYAGGYVDPASGHLHPLKLVRGLAAAAARAGVLLFEHSAVLGLEDPPGAPCRLRTAAGRVQADQVLLAGNSRLAALAPGLAPALAPRIMPVGTYIVTTEPLGEARCRALIPSRAAVCDTNFVLDYFRPTADHRLLFGGRVSYSTLTPPGMAASLQGRLQAVFPQLAGVPISHAWGGFVDISMNRAPDFGRLDARGRPGAAAGRVYYLQGFSGHGLALTGLAGRLVAEAMAGDAGRFDTFARLRHRPFPGGAALRTPALVLGMAWYRLRDAL